MKYNWQTADWPNFTYTTKGLDDILTSFRDSVIYTKGVLNGLPEDDKNSVVVAMMTSEGVKTSEIEGEILKSENVRSSIMKNLGIATVPNQSSDMRAKGVGELMAVVRKTFKKTLTVDMVLKWHSILMLGNRSITVGSFRTHKEDMVISSGRSFVNEKIHYIAPPSVTIPKEMDAFVKFFNDTAPDGCKEIKDAPVRSAILHYYFESIHPFEDGNGRIGRALAEKVLSQSLGTPILISLSLAITEKKSAYYDALQKSQKTCNITKFIDYFVRLIHRAQRNSDLQIEFTVKKSKFFAEFGKDLSTRQLHVITDMLSKGYGGFEKNMQPKTYVQLTGTSSATATRDIKDLLNKEIFILSDDSLKSKNIKYKINY